MIPTIGVMIGVYIIARMVDMMADPKRHVFVRTFAVIPAGVALLSIIDLLAAGLNAADQMPFPM